MLNGVGFYHKIVVYGVYRTPSVSTRAYYQVNEFSRGRTNWEGALIGCWLIIQKLDAYLRKLVQRGEIFPSNLSLIASRHSNKKFQEYIK